VTVTISSSDLAVPERALAIGAHPDDIEFQCGATLAKWSAAGCVVSHLILTDGSKGSWDPSADTRELVRTRQDEARAAHRALGGKGEVVFLHHVDGELQSDLDRRDEVVYWIRRIRPDVVLGHDPWRRYRLHPDHRHAGWLTVDGVVAARDPHFYPDHDVEHHRPSTLLLFEADAPDHLEDVTGFGEAKIAGLLAHRSQWLSTMDIPPDDDGRATEAFGTGIMEKLADRGRLGDPPVALAEVYKLMSAE
jgi:LmbE family N-acetylglucosaminyl deacetylase